ncbi:AAA family ATPase [Neobacillus niacini]|uniref:AAA family ATPase n=1 Tax=Neobacillus niacini TaxID=86668 RepID=UPI0021CB60CC|nr:AAA family ATPase [Neobacillus niacini]MCM3767359.1 AAA family ATPase [Neobacillus niacini]
MKIVSMHIYGYGQLENIQIDNLADFQVFFGENEAGKSTIMSFINSVLFGFPTKQQAELRYEPKHSTKYGGSIRIFHEEFGFAVIERVKGKAAGDVKVNLDNGTFGGEELLKNLLGNFDKGLFQAIYSFNIHGLQNIHQMKGEELGRFLFSAGTLGTERLAKAEAELQKELDSRFKPGGKKPPLNEKLHELHEINGELKNAAAKVKEYEPLIEKRERFLQESEKINQELADVHQQSEKLTEWKRVQSFVKEEKLTLNELEELGQIQFPVRGLERLQQLNQLILPHKAELVSMEERMKKAKLDLVELEPDESLAKDEPVIVNLLNQIPVLEQLTLEKGQYEQKLAHLEKELAVINEKLHLPLNEEDILAINTNIYMKKQVEDISRRGQKLLETKADHDHLLQEEKNALELMEKEVQLTSSLCLPKQERALLEEQVQGNDKRSLEEELRTIRDKRGFYQHSLELEQASRTRIKQQFFTIELILIGLTVYGALTKQWILMFLGFGACVVFAVFMFQNLKNSKQKETNRRLEDLKKQETRIIEKLQSAANLDIEMAEEKLKRDNLRIEQLQVMKVKLEQQQAQLQRAMDKLEIWEQESNDHRKALLMIGNELKIPEYMAASFLLEAFGQIEKFKEICREKHQLLEKIANINQQQKQITDELKYYENRYLSEKGLDLHKTVYLLKKKLEEEQEKRIKLRERRAKFLEMESDLQQKNKEQEQLEAEYIKLLGEANVETSQEFYELGEKAERRSELLDKLESLQGRLQFSILSKEECEHYLHIHNWDDLIEECQQRSRQLQARLKELQEAQAKVKVEIGLLEEGGTYSEILHLYKQKKFDLEEMAKEWAIYSLAQHILLETVEKYKSEHLPRMLEKAEEFLEFLTSGNYQRIHPHPIGIGFLVERKDHTLFEANELSQATTEQLYVSIRLALAITLYEKYQFPIIIDDGFVNFDAARTQRVIELLKSLGQKQILFFTCHQHLLPLFPKENIIQLDKGAVQIIS